MVKSRLHTQAFANECPDLMRFLAKVYERHGTYRPIDSDLSNVVEP
jgi:hypothetical protein